MKTISVQSKGKYFVYVQETLEGTYTVSVTDIEQKITKIETFDSEESALQAAKKYTEEM